VIYFQPRLRGRGGLINVTEKLSERISRDDSISAMEYVEAVEALESENITLRLDCFNSEQRALKAEAELFEAEKECGRLEEKERKLEDRLAKAQALVEKWRDKAIIKAANYDGVFWHTEREVGHLDCADELEVAVKGESSVLEGNK
jgi:hypothetical protein